LDPAVSGRKIASFAGKLTIVNLMNRAVLYNFLSSFSGTYFVSPRTVQAEMPFHF